MSVIETIQESKLIQDIATKNPNSVFRWVKESKVPTAEIEGYKPYNQNGDTIVSGVEGPNRQTLMVKSQKVTPVKEAVKPVEPVKEQPAKEEPVKPIVKKSGKK